MRMSDPFTYFVIWAIVTLGAVLEEFIRNAPWWNH